MIVQRLAFALFASLLAQPCLAEGDPVQPGVGEILKIPGMPDVPLPPGVHLYQPRPAPNGMSPGAPDGMVVGPGGVIPRGPMSPPRRAETPRKIPTPQERAEAIRKALVPHPPLALERRKALDKLYGKLAVAADTAEAKGLADLIGAVWMRSSSDTANLLMQRAMLSMQAKDYAVATQVLDKLVTIEPTWAEAWNKRASVRFLKGDLDGSMTDVEHVLALEPNHFGALEGMAMILQRTGLDKQALEVWRRALKVYPHQPEVEQAVEKLTQQVEGQGI